jgi:hypothetical protein
MHDRTVVYGPTTTCPLPADAIAYRDNLENRFTVQVFGHPVHT